ncbi:hypothetical protein RU639_013811, partial [Aspergillus parasiticus]
TPLSLRKTSLEGSRNTRSSIVAS